MSQSIDIYLTYCAMKAHFGKGDYDFIKYDGKTKVSRESFWKRKDRYFFVKVSKKYYLFGFEKSREEFNEYQQSKEGLPWYKNPSMKAVARF